MTLKELIFEQHIVRICDIQDIFVQNPKTKFHIHGCKKDVENLCQTVMDAQVILIDPYEYDLDIYVSIKQRKELQT